MSDALNVFLQLAIVGSVLSFFMEAIKAKFGPSSLSTKGLTIGLSIVLGAGVYFTFGTPVWTAAVGILAAASTVYALLLK